MSFFSTLQIQYSDDPIDIDSQSEKILKILKEDGIHSDVFVDLKAAFENTAGDLSIGSIYLLGLIESVAQMFPNSPFHARCLGEEFRYTWIREFENGSPVFSAGPWDY